MRHRVGHRDELDLARPDPAALPVAHGDQLGAVEQSGLLDAVPGQAEGECGAVDRERQLAQQVAEAPTWSSWPWVMIAPSTRSALSRR